MAIVLLKTRIPTNFPRKISKLRTYSPQFGSLEKFNRILAPAAGFCPFKLSAALLLPFYCPATALLLPCYCPTTALLLYYPATTPPDI